jgi:hypothetical protein
MNLLKLEEKLLSAARANPPSDGVPYAFERRIIANLKERPLLDVWAQWSRALWRAAAPCLGIMLVFGAWSFFGAGNSASSGDLSTDFENTVLAAVDQETGTDSLW